MGSIPESPLGKATRYPDAYDPALLYPVERAPQREELGLREPLPFGGLDRWTAWEATWLDAGGRPRVAIVTFDVPCTSPRLVESKSVKLWLASLAHERLDGTEALHATLRRDLSRATGADVDVAVHLPPQWSRLHARAMPAGIVVDDEASATLPARPDAELLRSGGNPVDETLVMQTFRSLCPVTGQPDYADIVIGYRGARIDRGSLLAYLIGFRQHPGFHEHCVERIFVDVDHACRPERLRVEARFTRRGGVDINPVRARGLPSTPSVPTLRQ